MDRNTILLIGVLDTLLHILETEPSSKTRKDSRAACKRLAALRRELLTEGLRYSKILGAARDSIMDLSMQLQGHLTGQRDMQWIINGLLTVNAQAVDPPPPPSSSSSNPKPVPRDVMELVQALIESASAPSKSRAQLFRVDRLVEFPSSKTNQAKGGRVSAK